METQKTVYLQWWELLCIFTKQFNEWKVNIYIQKCTTCFYFVTEDLLYLLRHEIHTHTYVHTRTGRKEDLTVGKEQIKVDTWLPKHTSIHSNFECTRWYIATFISFLLIFVCISRGWCIDIIFLGKQTQVLTISILTFTYNNEMRNPFSLKSFVFLFTFEFSLWMRIFGKNKLLGAPCKNIHFHSGHKFFAWQFFV